jgi:putative endonuclease
VADHQSGGDQGGVNNIGRHPEVAAKRGRDHTNFSISSLPGLTRQSMLTGGMKSFWIYILSSRPRGTLYVGVTNNLIRRIYEHREGLADGFSKEHGVKMLVYYEQHTTVISAIQREKNIKHWSRKWKIDLIRSMNPDWRDLWENIVR